MYNIYPYYNLETIDEANEVGDIPEEAPVVEEERVYEVAVAVNRNLCSVKFICYSL